MFLLAILIYVAQFVIADHFVIYMIVLQLSHFVFQGQNPFVVSYMSLDVREKVWLFFGKSDTKVHLVTPAGTKGTDKG